MRSRRFSVSSLCVAIAVLALGCAALTRSTELWASVVFTVTLAVLALATLALSIQTVPCEPFTSGLPCAARSTCSVLY